MCSWLEAKSVSVSICLWLFLAAVPAFAQENLSVDFDTVIQENFLGVNAVYHAFTYMPESIEQGMTDELRKIELDRVEESGLHIARTFYRPDWAMGENVWAEPDWNSKKMKALYAWLADMKERNVDVALNMGWWFARDVIWNRDQHLPTYPDDMEKYVHWVSESLHQIIEKRGFTNVKYIFMFTEPAGSYGDIPNGKTTWDYYKEVLLALHNKLVADNRRGLVRLIGPNTTEAPRWVEKSAQELGEVIDIFASHNYNFDTYQKWYEMALQVRESCKSTGKPFWIDEYGLQDFARRRKGEYGNIIAQVNAAIINAGAQSSLIWIFNDQYYPYPLKYITNGDAFLDGKHSWGLFPWLPENRGVRPAWHAFTLLSRLMGGEGTKVYATRGTDYLHIAATKHSDENVSMLLVNESKVDLKFGIQLSKSLNKPIFKYLYDPEKMPRAQHERINAANLVTGHIPPKGVLIYSTINDSRLDAEGYAQDVLPDAGNTEGNLALFKKVTLAYSAPNWSSQNLTDGKRLTHWEFDPSLVGEQEFTIDLEKIYALHQIDVYMKRDNFVADKGAGVKKMSAFVSADEKKWIPVGLGIENSEEMISILPFKFAEHPARYVRLSIVQPHGGGGVGQKVQIREIKVYGR